MNSTLRLAGLAVVGGLAVSSTASAQNGYDTPTPGGKPTVSISVRPTTGKAALKKGVKVDVTCNVACNASVRAYRGAKEFGSASRTLSGASGTLTIKLTSAAKSKLKAGKALKFTVAGSATDGAGRASSIVTKEATVKGVPKKKKKQ